MKIALLKIIIINQKKYYIQKNNKNDENENQRNSNKNNIKNNYDNNREGNPNLKKIIVINKDSYKKYINEELYLIVRDNLNINPDNIIINYVIGD